MNKEDLANTIERTQRRLVSWLVLTIVFAILDYMKILPWMNYLTLLALIYSVIQLLTLLYLKYLHWQNK